MKFCFKILLVAATSLAGTGQAQPAPEFMPSQSIYQIFTDRFFDGDASNNNASGSYNATSGGNVNGGDFKGIQQKLDYIKSLGATAIWISPIVLNGYGEYHGYSGRDFYHVDPHWGSLADLTNMVNAAHAKGLLVILDVVVNHGSTLNNINGNTGFNLAGYTLNYASATRQYAAPFNTNSAFPNLTNLFHNYGAIQDYGNTTQVEQGELAGLDDFRSELPYIRTNMAAVYNYWIQTAGFDGFRVDTVKHCEMGFWQDWCPRVHAFAATNSKPDFFMFGEVFDGSDVKCGSYSGTNGGGAYKLDSLLDYPLFFACQRIFEYGTGSPQEIEDHYNVLAADYDPATQNQLVTFLDNHDTTRFLNSANANGDTNRLAVALTFLLTARGVPCVYQGTEQGFNGGADPNNREDMWAGGFEQGPSLGDNFNMTHPLYQLIARLNNFRRLYAPLRGGAHSNLWYTSGGPGLFAYSRVSGTQSVFVAFNTASTTQLLPPRPTIHAPGTVLVNLLNTNETLVVAGDSQTPTLGVPAWTAKLFIAQSQWQLPDPVITSISPAHDTTNVNAGASFALTFSQPMNTNSVAAAFSTVPATSGSFAWNAGGDALTYTPAGTWPTQTLVTIKLTDAITNLAGTRKLWAGFESRFRTGALTDGVAPSVAIASPASNSVVGGLVTIAGTAMDYVGLQRVEVRVDSNAWLTASGTASWSYSLNTSNFLNGSHVIGARATDLAGNLSVTSFVPLRFLNVPGAYLQRLACGNPANVTNCDGTLWPLDVAYASGGFGYVGGSGGYLANTITGICAAAQSLYQRERYGSFSYRFDCPMGVYETTLLEAETYWSAAGQRVFNVSIEGQPALTNFDIYQQAGGPNKPLTRVFTNNVSDAQLEIIFTPLVDNARASGLQVKKLADLFSDADGLPDWWRLAYFDHATGLAADLSRAGDDADGDGASNWNEFLAGTDPRNPASVLRIAGFSITNGTNVALSCATVTNRSYQLQSADGLNASTWIPIGAPVSGANGPASWTESLGKSNRFYRVEAY